MNRRKKLVVVCGFGLQILAASNSNYGRLVIVMHKSYLGRFEHAEVSREEKEEGGVQFGEKDPALGPEWWFDHRKYLI